MNDTGVFAPNPEVPCVLIVWNISLLLFVFKNQFELVTSNCSGDPTSPAALSETRLSIFSFVPPYTINGTLLSAFVFDDANLIWLLGDPATTIQSKSVYADNLDLDTEAGFDTATVSDDILDFTEANPFGEVK